MSSESPASRRQEPLAITGIGCRFPGGVDGPDAFWQLLRDGRDAVSEVPPERWDLGKFFDEDPDVPGKSYSKWGGFLDQVQGFDAQFFGISPREAVHVDPQQRLILEVAWEAFADAGETVDLLSGSDTGVFVGISSHDYSDIQVKGPAPSASGHYASTGAALSIAANRLSYVFNLRGPSFAVDTACSSSLVALHLACQSLWEGECRLALCGGVNCILTPEATISFSKAAMLSPDGRCKAFDASANGYVRGEGAGVVVLKRLSDAVASGDRVYAVIRGTGVNQDGRTQGLTLPNRAAQEVLLRSVYRRAGIQPEHVRYVEAHGTGTAAGDPIEANAIGTVLGKGRQLGDPLWMGSVKTNIGHLEAASGMAGVIKTVLALYHGMVPPSLHFTTPNPRIAFDDFHLRVPVSAVEWPAGNGPRVAGVNSFGFGGTNAHVVLSDPPVAVEPPPTQVTSDGTTLLLPLSARLPEALRALALRWLQQLEPASKPTSLPQLCRTASVRSSHHEHRLALAFRTRDDLRDRLEGFLNDEGRTGMAAGRALPGRPPKVAFVFSGMGPQWWGMGRELLAREPVFREAIERCDREFLGQAGWSIRAEMLADESRTRMGETMVSQPANFALQVGLAALWRSWGIEPAVIIGHSAGEVAAAHVAGVLSLEDAVRVIFHRSRLQQRARGSGAMLAMAGSVDDARRVIEGFEDRVSVAAVNSAHAVTLSGETDALRQVADLCGQRNQFARFLTVDVPYHSPCMDPLELELRQCLRPVTPEAPLFPIISTVTGRPAGERDFDADYWWRNVREPVQFAAAVAGAIQDGVDTFVELAPHPVLGRPIIEQLIEADVKGVVLPSLRRDDSEQLSMRAAAGGLYVRGCPVDWRALYPQPLPHVGLPSYPWQRETFWTEPEASKAFRFRRDVHPLLGRRLEHSQATWEVELDDRAQYLFDHQVQESIVFPAAGYLEMALAAANQLHPADAYLVTDMEVPTPLILSKNATAILQTTVDGRDGRLTIASRGADAAKAWTTHATARLVACGDADAPGALDVEGLRSKCRSRVTRSDCYLGFAERGLHYGPSFQGIEELWRGQLRALGRVVAPPGIHSVASGYLLQPALLDSCLQALVGAIDDEADGAAAGVYVPVRIGAFRLHKPHKGGTLWSAARVVRRKAGFVEADYRIASDTGEVLAEVSGFQCRLLATGRAIEAGHVEGWLSTLEWYARERPGGAHRSPDFLVAPAEVARALGPEFERLRVAFKRQRHYREVAPRFEELCTVYVCEAFEALGWTPRLGQRVDLQALAGELRVVPRYHRYMAGLLDMLTADGFLGVVPGGWRVRRAPKKRDSQALYETLLVEFPDYEAELALMAHALPRLPGVLRGETDAVRVLFPDGSLGLAGRFYREGIAIYQTMVQRAVEQAVSHLPRTRALRVLEIGAGTGATTARLLPVLAPRRTEYVFTDLSQTFAVEARKAFSHFPNLECRHLDIGLDPVAQGYDAHSFDIVVATDVLHATRDLRRSLAHVASLLAPGGLLLCLEATSATRLVELVFGMQEGWWLFEDRDLRPDHPWMPVEDWHRVLADAGFDDVASMSDAEDGRAPDQTVILARRGETGMITARTAVSEAGTWLVFADESGVGRRLAEALTVAGQQPVLVWPGTCYERLAADAVRIDPGQLADMRRLLDGLDVAERPLRGVVHLWGLDTPATEHLDSAGLNTAETLGCITALHLVQALQPGQENDPRLFIVTRGAQQPEVTTAAVAVAQAPLWGFGRVVLSEQPSLRCTLIDLDPDRPAGDVDRLRDEVLCAGEETEMALRDGVRYVSRVTPLASGTLRPEAAGTRRAGKPGFALEVGTPGALDSLVLRQRARRRPGVNEIEVAVESAALNFRDVMKAMRLLPPEADDRAYGTECAGRVVRIGKGVDTIAVGDRVIALTDGALASHVTAQTGDVYQKPERLSFEQAAGIPSAFLTAEYSLRHLARLSTGERVLIHAATGGVGLAALQVARRIGAEVVATAGTPAKRALLRSLGVRMVADSRSLRFADAVRDLTRGAGVDVVLNSLAGEFIPSSLSLLRPGGRFVELGKVDIYQNTRLGLLPFKNALSYFAVDMLQVQRDHPALVRALMLEILQQFEDGHLQPLPTEHFHGSEVGSAFRHMAQARHVGKVVVSFSGAVPVSPAPAEGPKLRTDGSYLITGGLGGFGLAVAHWMVRAGARHLVLVGRSGASTPEAEAAVAFMRTLGAQVRVAQADVSDPTQVEALVADVSSAMPPLRGVVHAAMVLDDGLVVQLDARRFRNVTAPKVHGAWNLHLATRTAPLDFFVCFSSEAAIIGAPGQANYAAANTFLDVLARARRAEGRPGLAINWGSIAKVGYVARHAHVSRYLEGLGLRPFKPHEATSTLGHLLDAPLAQVGAMRIDFQTLAANVPNVASAPRLAHVVQRALQDQQASAGETQGSHSLREAIRGAAPEDARTMVDSFLRKELAKILGTSPGKVDLEQPLTLVGIDSLMAVELEARFEAELGVAMPRGSLLGPDVTARQLGERLLHELLSDNHRAAAPPEPHAEKTFGVALA